MKLNAECIRDILLFLENKDTFVLDIDGRVEAEPCWYGTICDALPAYRKTDIIYTLKRLDEGGYIEISESWASNTLQALYVNCITFDGHQFLDSIRDDTRWAVVRSGLSAVRDYSLSAIAAIAEGMTSAAITKYFSNK